MSAPSPDPSQLDAALRRVHRGVLATLAVCALLIGAAAGAGEGFSEMEVDRRWSVAALALAAGTILTRRSTKGTPRQIVYRTLVSMVLAGGLGLLGVAIALREDQTTVGLLYTLAGGILSLRPPTTLAGPDAGDTA